MKTLNILSQYLPYGLQVALSKTLVLTMTAEIERRRNEAHIADIVRLESYVPLLVPMSDLPEYMGKVLIDVSLKDLSDCKFTTFIPEANVIVVNAIRGKQIVEKLQYDGNIFLTDQGAGFETLSPQYSGFAAFAKHHIDYMGLIEAGEAYIKSDYVHE